MRHFVRNDIMAEARKDRLLGYVRARIVGIGIEITEQ